MNKNIRQNRAFWAPGYVVKHMKNHFKVLFKDELKDK